MILSRQARDKHRESTHLKDRFVQVRLRSDHIRDVCVSRPGADAVSLGLVWVSQLNSGQLTCQIQTGWSPHFERSFER